MVGDGRGPAGSAMRERGFHFFEHLFARHTHQVDGVELFVFAVQEPCRRAVRLPPEGVRDGFVGSGNVRLHGDDAALMVHAHEDA